jgi:hypothetical protein
MQFFVIGNGADAMTKLKIHILPSGLYRDGNLRIQVSTHHGFSYALIWTADGAVDEVRVLLDDVEHVLAGVDEALDLIDKHIGEDRLAAARKPRHWSAEGPSCSPMPLLYGSAPPWR